MGSNLLAVRRLIVYVLVTLIAVPIQICLIAVRSPWSTQFPMVYHRVCARVLGLKLIVHGTMSRQRPMLFVANHSSYLDIMVLGGLINGSFIAKAEVRDWPFFGVLARLQRTVFVDRRPSAVTEHRSAIVDRLQAGDNLILFPEGTSSDGNRTLPFKSALFSVAEVRVGDQALPVQPVSVTCTALDGIPLGRWMRPVYAWYGDMALVPHIWDVAKAGQLTVSVVFHAVESMERAGSRKALARTCWTVVADGVAQANAGRLGPRRGKQKWLRRPAKQSNGPPDPAEPGSTKPATAEPASIEPTPKEEERRPG